MKDRLFAFSERVPLLGRSRDPFMAMVLSGFAAVVLLAVALPEAVFPGDHEARTHVLQLAGGFLVLGGFYFVAVNLRDNRAAQHADRLVATLGLLASKDKATRTAAIVLLEEMSTINPNLPQDSISRATAMAQRRAILAALDIAQAGYSPGRESQH
jgi:hypothetical protein